MTQPLVRVEGLSIETASGRPILRDLSLTLGRGKTLGLAGESGSGKTMTALGVIGLLPAGLKTTGRIVFEDNPLPNANDPAWDDIRGRRIGMVFQEPLTALNPAMSIADQVAEGLVRHRGIGWRQGRRDAVALLDRVRIPRAAERAKNYPHELSGGQRQRVGIAIAIALRPALLIADEPTTALDVTVQREILDLLAELVRDEEMALMLISHDPGVLAYATENLLVLRHGDCVESGPTRQVLTAPSHPYTRGLLEAIPRGSHRQRRLPMEGR